MLKGSLKAIKLGGAERGGMYRMEIPKFNLAVVLIITFVIVILVHHNMAMMKQMIIVIVCLESLCSWTGDGNAKILY